MLCIQESHLSLDEADNLSAPQKLGGYILISKEKDFNDSLPVLQKMQEICPIFMLHTNGIFSDMKTYFGMSQPVFMIILNVGLIFVFYRLTKNISKKHQVTG